jgi:hypothetical protein
MGFVAIRTHRSKQREFEQKEAKETKTDQDLGFGTVLVRSANRRLRV